MKKVLMIGIFLMPGISYAGIDTDMANFYTGMGGNVNVTPSGLYESQAGGFYSGGGIYARAPVRSYNLLTVTPPSITAGCGGIDAYLGGFSFINKAQFTSMLRNIGNNSQGYIFNLALQTFAPQIYSITQDLQTTIQKINAASINSCETAEMMVDGLVGAVTQKSVKGCQSIAMARGYVSDYKEAETYCQNPTNLNAIYSWGTMSPAEKEKQYSNKNIMWEGLDKNTYTGLDTPLKELLMSLVGTYVVETINGTPTVKYLPPTAIKIEDLLNGTNGAATAEVYKCGNTDPGCLNPTKVNISITGYRPLAVTAINDIKAKLSAEKTIGAPATPLLPATLDLMSVTDIPIMRSMSVAVALGPSVSSQFANMLADPVAFGIVAKYLEWAYSVAGDAVRRAGVSAPEGLVSQIMPVIEKRERELNTLRQRNDTLQSAYQIIEKTIFYERVLVSNMSPDLQAVFQYAKAHR